jgi:EPS-associated MarR family transcriptional regulator
MLAEETRYKLMCLIEANPEMSQREVARELGISLGKVNYSLRALMRRGWVKATNFKNSNRKAAYMYLLTPRGIEEKGGLAVRFLKLKMREYESLRVEAGDEIDLVTLARVAWGYRRIIACSTAIFGIAAAYLAFTATPVFEAEVVVAEVHDRNMGGLGSLVNQLGGIASLAGVNVSAGDSASREAQAVLQSRHLIEVFITRQDLVAKLIPPGKKPPTLWQAVRRFRSDVIHVREDPRKGLTTLTVDWTDPVTSANWANGLVALANELIRTRALNDASRNIAYLNEQIAKNHIVDIQRVMYNLVETETKTLMLANGRPDYAFTIVDPAVVPEVRISPKRTIWIMIGLVLGSVIGLVIAFTHNNLREKSRTAASGATTN